MKERIITIAALFVVMVAMTGVASATNVIFQKTITHEQQDPWRLHNGETLSLDILLDTINPADLNTIASINVGFGPCSTPTGVFCNENVDVTRNNRGTFLVTGDPMRLESAMNATLAVPLDRPVGTQYPFTLTVFLVHGEAPGPAQTIELVGSNISGKKCNDLNGDGICGQGEPGLQGWTIILRDENGTVVANTTTDQNGNYKFTRILNGVQVGFRGNFTVEEVLQTGWTQTGPQPVPPGTWEVTVDAVDVTGLDFANNQFHNISGMKFNDKNNNSLKDAGEEGLAGWTIDLNFTNGTVYRTTTTASDGSYKFEKVPPGSYVVEEIQQDGWRQTFPTTLNGKYDVTFTNMDITGLDFGNFKIEKPCVDRCKVTGWGTLGPKAAPELTFQIFAFTDFMPKGVVKAEDSAGNKIEATEIKSVVTNKKVDPMTGEITGMAMFNNEGPFAFVVKVTDGGDPSIAPYVSKDTFDISIPAKSYHKAGKLTSGNLQVIY